MKIAKKIWVGLILSFSVLVFMSAFPKHSMAYVATSPDQIKNATFKYVNAVTIAANIGGQTVNFVTDPNPIYITQIIYKAQGYDCYGQIAMPADKSKGFSLNDLKTDPSLVTASTEATIDIDYNANQSKCQSIPGNTFTSTIGNPELASAFFTQTDANTIKSVINSDVFTKSTDGLFYKNGESQCVDRLSVIGNGVVYYELDANKGISVPGPDIGLGDIGGCKVLRINFQAPSSVSDAQTLSQTTVVVAGLSATDGSTGCSTIACRNTSGTGSASGDTANSDDGTCELNSSGFSLAWVMCPILAAATDFSNFLTNKFEDQLSFNVSQDIRTDNGGQTKVKTTWVLVKNLATAFLVIIMLVMVISQAIGSGPFDAYVIRKMLPRLVVAVIVMQLSWPLFAWVVDIFDHAGKGLGDLMYAPFGGPDQLKLGSLLANAKIGNGTAAVINWVGLIAVIGLGMASLPMLMASAVAASVALLVALITLIFRKILIIMALILAPIALLAWILPGTQKYWKLWQDNFIKALAMFPLAVAIIAAGRIFAYVVGTQGNGTFLNLLLVMVGFFGPLFILPRTFKWGGGIMSMVGNTVSSTFKPGTDKMAAGARGIGERWQGKRAKAYDPNDANFKIQRNRFGVPMLGGKVLRRVQSGHFIPTDRSQRLAIQAGDKWSGEEDEMALALIKRKGEKVMREGYEAGLKTEDGSHFAKYKRYQNDAGQFLDENGQVVATEAEAAYVGKNGQVTTDADKADRVRVNSYQEADKRTMTGVQAMKQMWVDLAEDGRDDHERKMAIRQLTATSSWPEIQGSLTKSGRKVVDTEAWAPSITTSPEDYPRVLRSRVDAAPHIVDSAAAAAEKAGFARTDQSYEARNYRSAERIDYAIEKQMSNEDFQSQSDGFWEEAARIAKQVDANGKPTEQALRIRGHLRERFQAIQDAGPTARQSMLGHLAAGGSLQKNVDDILGDGLSVSNFIHGDVEATEQPPPAEGQEPAKAYAVVPGREQRARSATQRAAPQQATPAAQAPDGELRIPRGPATGWNAGPEYPPEPIEPPETNPPTSPPNTPSQ